MLPAWHFLEMLDLNGIMSSVSELRLESDSIRVVDLCGIRDVHTLVICAEKLRRLRRSGGQSSLRYLDIRVWNTGDLEIDGTPASEWIEEFRGHRGRQAILVTLRPI